MSEQNLRASLRRAVPEPPDLDAAALRRRAARMRRNRISVASAGVALLGVTLLAATATLAPDGTGHSPAGDRTPTVIPWASSPPAPDPMPPGSPVPLAGEPIEVQLIVEQRARRGQRLSFIARIANTGAEPVSLDPCPYYRARYLQHVETGSLNCDRAPDSIPAHGHLDFEMQIAVPAALGSAAGDHELSWQLGGEGAEGETATAMVELTGAAGASALPTCHLVALGKASSVGAGFVVELNIMSGNPNPMWRLSRAEGIELRRLLRESLRGVRPDGGEGGLGLRSFGVTADRDASIGFLRGLGLPETFWVRPDSRIAKLLDPKTPCKPRGS